MENARRTQTPEHRKAFEQHKPIFDLEQLEPEQVADLIAIIGDRFNEESRQQCEPDVDDGPETAVYFTEMLEDELSLIAHQSDKALDIYMALAKNSSSDWPPHLAIVSMAIPLIERNLNNLAVRQQIIAPWLNLLQHDSAVVQEAAETELCKLVHANLLDESTARLIDAHLPGDWRRW